jgi:hypothetical protein
MGPALTPLISVAVLPFLLRKTPGIQGYHETSSAGNRQAAFSRPGRSQHKSVHNTDAHPGCFGCRDYHLIYLPYTGLSHPGVKAQSAFPALPHIVAPESVKSAPYLLSEKPGHREKPELVFYIVLVS